MSMAAAAATVVVPGGEATTGDVDMAVPSAGTVVVRIGEVTIAVLGPVMIGDVGIHAAAVDAPDEDVPETDAPTKTGGNDATAAAELRVLFVVGAAAEEGATKVSPLTMPSPLSSPSVVVAVEAAPREDTREDPEPAEAAEKNDDGADAECE